MVEQVMMNTDVVNNRNVMEMMLDVGEKMGRERR
jgi:hypothetical protein